MNQPKHRNYFIGDEFAYLNQLENENFLTGFYKVYKIFNIHPWTINSIHRNDFKIDSFEKLRMYDPF